MRAPDDRLEGIRWPAPTIAVPAEVLEAEERIRRELVAPLSERIRREVTPAMGWLDRVDYVVDRVAEYGPLVVDEVRRLMASAPRADRAAAATDALLRLAKWLERRVDVVPGWLEWAAWLLIRRGVRSLADRIIRELEERDLLLGEA